MASLLFRMPGSSKNLNSKRNRSSIRVLVVDDFYPLANAFMHILATNFYDARVAYTASEALDIARDFGPHAVIADVTLPDMDGFQLAAEFETHYPDCRVLLMTACSFSAPKNGRGPRVIQKASLLEEAFRLLDGLRRRS